MKLKIRILFIGLLFLITSESKSQTLDQNQLNYNIDMSGRNLLGYSLFQYFTAGITGTLTQIDIVFMPLVDSMNGTATLNIYSGADTNGALLQSVPVSITCIGNDPCWANFMLSVPVVAGEEYTFRFIPGPGVSDPYFLQGERPGTYAGGQMGFINPVLMAYAQQNATLVFRTYVLPDATGIQSSANNFSFEVFPNPAKEMIHVNWKNNEVNIHATELIITDISGRTVIQTAVSGEEANVEVNDMQNGLYFMMLKDAKQRTLGVRKVIID